MEAGGYIKPLFAVGDSQCIALNALLLHEHPDKRPVAIGQSLYVPRIRAADAMNSAGAIHPAIVAALAACCFLVHWPPPAEERLAIPHHGLQLGAHPWSKLRYMLFVIGSIDVREITNSIPPDAAVLLPFQADFSNFPKASADTTIPTAVLRECILGCFRPLFQTLVRLREVGLPHLALASIPPPALSDDAYFKHFDIDRHARVRYAVVLFANALCREFCEQSGIAFLDTWEASTDRNIVKAGWLPDDTHMGPEGAAALLERLYSMTANLKLQ